MPASLTVYFHTNVWSDVVHRPLATQGHQRTTTPVASGSSFSSTTWRVVSSEGKASWFLSRSIFTVNLIGNLCNTVSWGHYMYFIKHFFLLSLCRSDVIHLFWCHSPNVCFSQGSHWKVPAREVPGGVQRQEWEVSRRPSHSHFYLIFHHQYVDIKTSTWLI